MESNEEIRRIDFDRFKREVLNVPEPQIEPRGHKTEEREEFSHVLRQVVHFVKPGNLVHWFSDGKWSMWQLLEALLDRCQSGHLSPADVCISSYAFSEKSARMLARMKTENKINEIRCVIDNRTDTRTPESLQLLKGICTELKMISTHAKVTLVQTMGLGITIIGSANYTENKRYEAGTISCNREVYRFHRNWIDKELYYNDPHTK